MTTDTTREGFEKWLQEWMDPASNRRGDIPNARDGFIGGYQAAKADELAFLESLIPPGVPMVATIANRIAELKGESRE